MLFWIVAGGIVLAVAFVLYCCCRVSGIAERRVEAFFQEKDTRCTEEQP